MPTALGERVARRYLSRSLPAPKALHGALGVEEQARQPASRVAGRYLQGPGRTARTKMTPWDGEDHDWPAVDESVWDENHVTRDRFGDVFVMEYGAFGLAGTPKVTIDTRPWTHDKRPEFTFTIEVFGATAKTGKIKIQGYEREIQHLLDEALKLAGREAAAYAKQLAQLKVPDWKITYDERGDDLVVEYEAPGLSEYSDSSMSGSFYGPLSIFTGGTCDYDISYSQGADYEGPYGKKSLKGKVKSIADIKRVLKEAEQLWKKAEATLSGGGS